MGLSQSIENIMDGKDYQRGSIEKDGNRQINSETIQDEEITISRISYKPGITHHNHNIPWPIKKYLDN